MPITLSEATDRFTGRYGNTPYETQNNINLVIERFLSQGNWVGTKGVANFNLYEYEQNNLDFKQFTLDRSMRTVKGIRFNAERGQTWNRPINHWWFQWTNNQWWPNCGGDVQDLGLGYSTFRDWSVDSQLRVRTDTAQTGTINIRGIDENGLLINAGAGEDLDLSVNPATTTATFKAFSQIQVVKTPTNGIVKLYSWDGVTETLVGYYYPSDKVISYRRYRVPNSIRYESVEVACLRQFVPLTDPNDVIWPDNIGALENGLMGLAYERATQDDLAQRKWDTAYELLNGSLAQEQGNAQPFVKIIGGGFGQYNLWQPQ